MAPRADSHSGPLPFPSSTTVASPSTTVEQLGGVNTAGSAQNQPVPPSDMSRALSENPLPKTVEAKKVVDPSEHSHPSSQTGSAQNKPVPASNMISAPSENPLPKTVEVNQVVDRPGDPSKKTTNIVLFGETGVGKSSVINLIAGKDVAKVSSDVDGCTMASNPYDITLGKQTIRIFDTVGLEEPQMGVNGYLAAIEKAYELILSLSDAGGVHLLLFCMRGGRITATVQSNYRLFCEFLCNKKVPVALVFTGLEREDVLEDWWKRNEKNINKYGIHSVGHACVTAVRDDSPGQAEKYATSQTTIRELLVNHALKDSAFRMDSHSWLVMIGRRMMGLIVKRINPKRRDIMKVLTKRCGLDADTAKRVAQLMKEREAEAQPDAEAGAVAEAEAGKEAEGEAGKEAEAEVEGERGTVPVAAGVRRVVEAAGLRRVTEVAKQFTRRS
ncbi:hypothetical protein PAXRUDRAFT_587261 [Paxillus rubicundulus Ve08.2h10]|uniref:G domain-containing protein n=1 Tax=Paxillus rubicundulus Ve08.2h10 TaxID=930991 RepID=A0A0D0E934_9AGAM|nr:hypothetical protein PAXRUDRAFT_587261 [Paxillus rubicundulus Ve08.2h10]